MAAARTAFPPCGQQPGMLRVESNLQQRMGETKRKYESKGSRRGSRASPPPSDENVGLYEMGLHFLARFTIHTATVAPSIIRRRVSGTFPHTLFVLATLPGVLGTLRLRA